MGWTRAEADEVRARVLVAVCDATPADVAFWYRPDPRGVPAAWGAPDDIVRETLARAARPGEPWAVGLDTLVRPLPGWTRSFVRADELDDLRRALGLADSRRLLVYLEGRLVAYVAIGRRLTIISRRGASRLRSMVSRVREAFTRAAKMERPADGACGSLVFDGREVVHADEAGRTWLADDGVRAAVMGISPLSTQPGELLVGGCRLRWAQLQGESGRTVVRVLVDRAPYLTARPDAVLSPVQRRIAQMAAKGRSTAHIARSLKRSPETIKSHLKEVYLRMDISSRSELARELTADAEDQDPESLPTRC